VRVILVTAPKHSSRYLAAFAADLDELHWLFLLRLILQVQHDLEIMPTKLGVKDVAP
jgi:hypothetical protein